MTERASTATVVFTGLIGASALRARLGEEQADAVQRIHDGIVRVRVEACGGEVLKTQGDGMVAVFPAASDALTATVQIQQAIVRYNRRPDARADLSVRIGLSTGDVSWEGGDCFGTPMVEAARLVAAAEGGQILCTEFVRMMARGRGGHELSDLGFLELKGLPEPVATCEVRWAPAPEVAFPLPLELDSGVTRPFVSRTAELELAETVLTESTRRQAAVLWLLGEPGIGKTRLATEIARQAHGDGAVVLFGRCHEDLTLPYQPFLEALRFFAAQVPDEELAERLGADPDALIRLLPELAARLRHHHAAREGNPEAALYRLFEAVRSWLAAAGGAKPVVFVVDDLHWAARPTLQLLSHIARSREASNVLLVCTARNTSPDDNEALAALVEELETKASPSHRLELGGLGLDDVGALVASAAGRPLDDRLRTLAGELTDETSGNPLFVDALLNSLPADPAWHAGAIPRSIAETVRRRVARLPAPVHDLLRAASVAGLDFELSVAARAAGHAEFDALEALETAGRAGLVTETGVDRYRFAHALVRLALRDGLGHSRRVRLHLAVGEALEALHGPDLEEHSAALAYHFFEAAPAGGAGKACRYSLLAAGRAERLLAFSEAADAYGRALEVLDQAGDPDPLSRTRLLLARGKAQRRSSDFRAALATLRTAADSARRLDAPDLLAETAVAFEDAGFEPGFPGHEAAELLEEAAAALGPGRSGLHALTTGGLARALEFSGRHHQAVETADRALAMARKLGDPAVTGEVLYRAGLTRVMWAEVHELAEMGAELAELAGPLDDAKLSFFGFWFRAHSALRLGQLGLADACTDEIVDVVRRAGEPLWEWELLVFRASQAMVAGDLALAEQLVDRLHGIEHRDSTDERPHAAIGAYVGSVVGVVTFLLRREQGRLGGLLPILQTVVELSPSASLWGPGLASLYAELGLLDDARAELERLAADDFAAIPHDGTREQCLAFLAEVAPAVGDGPRAARLFDELLPTQGTLLIFWGNDTCLGPADRLLGMLASTSGRDEEAENRFEAAVSFSRRMPSPLWLAHCLYDHAEHRRRTGRDGAAPMLAEAAELCERHGLVGLAARVRAHRHG